MRKLFLSVAVLALCACQANGPKRDAAQIHKDTLTLDTHVDIPINYMTEIDPGTETELQVDLGKMKTGGLDVAFFIVYTPQGELTDAGYQEGAKIAATRLQAIQKMSENYKDQIILASSVDDVRNANEAGKLVALIGVENAYPLGYDCDVASRAHAETIAKADISICDPDIFGIKSWAARGVRYMGITHFGHNQYGDSSNPHPERDNGPRHNGLSEAGRQLVKDLNKHGIMVDVSHAGKGTMMQAADLSRSPIIASHSGVKAIADSARNLDDEQLRKIAAVGGVAQMVALDAYVKPYTEAQTKFRENLRKELSLETSEDRAAASAEVLADYEKRILGMWDIEPRASVADFVDHIDHAVKIAGIDYVGIASDFDGGGGVAGWQDASETPNVTAELVKRGYSNQDIAKIWGGNLLRVMEAAEKAALE